MSSRRPRLKGDEVTSTNRGDNQMNDSYEDPTDPSTPRAGIPDEVIQAFIDRVLNDGSRRHYLSVRRPRDSQEESQ